MYSSIYHMIIIEQKGKYISKRRYYDVAFPYTV